MAAQEIQQMVMDANTVTTIANNINALYSNAISQLTSYTLGIVALVGILIPVLVTLFQWRSLRVEKESLEKHITDEIIKAKSSLRAELELEMQRRVASEESVLLARVEEKLKKLEERLLVADASTFHIQGNFQLEKNFFALAAEDFCLATTRYLRGGDELNGRRTLSLLNDCLPNINKDDFDNFDFGGELDSLVEFLREINANNRYKDVMSTLIRESKAARIRASNG